MKKEFLFSLFCPKINVLLNGVLNSYEKTIKRKFLQSKTKSDILIKTAEIKLKNRI